MMSQCNLCFTFIASLLHLFVDISYNLDYYLQLPAFIFPFQSHHFLHTFPIIIQSQTAFFQGLDHSNRHQVTHQALLTSYDVTVKSPLHLYCLNSAPVCHQHIATGQIPQCTNGIRHCHLWLLTLLVWRETEQISGESQTKSS